jgi:UDP-N-acetylmuramoyl-tripeptide--D-alanyl-D-alanine ligase
MKNFLKSVVVYLITLEAKLVLNKYKPKIAAVTGSVGKTSTKDAMYRVISSGLSARKSQKSFNSEIGVPLTVLDCENAWSNPFHWIKNLIVGLKLIIFNHDYPEWLVLEVGAGKPGDIESISRWLKTDLVVITSFGTTPVHVEFFSSPEEVYKEKGYLVKTLKESSPLVLNADDEISMSYMGERSQSVVTYGINEPASVQASNIDFLYEGEVPIGFNMKIDHKGNSMPMDFLGTIGRQHVYPILAAFATGISLGMNPIAISQSLSGYIPPEGRMRLIEGIKNTIIIDDSYNSSPIAVYAALEALRDLKTSGGRKIAVLGDMKELGKYTEAEHKIAGENAAGFCRIIVAVGEHARFVAEGALMGGMSEKDIFQFEDSKIAGKFVEGLIEKGDVILVKGSQSVRTEKVVEEIMRYPEKREEMLVRQAKEWQNR